MNPVRRLTAALGGLAGRRHGKGRRDINAGPARAGPGAEQGAPDTDEE